MQEPKKPRLDCVLASLAGLGKAQLDEWCEQL